MTSKEIRERFLKFFEARGHAIVPSSSLVPENDPSVLLTTAGMQQFKSYYTNPSGAMEKFGSVNVASIQKIFRTSDIDEVGDDTHLTFFEMLGNFSFGGYFKKESIEYAHEFITVELGLALDYVTVFEGDADMGIPKDEESKEIWRSLGVTDVREQGKEDVFWGPTGEEGPCGPTTEIYVNGVEIWNIVFNEYYHKDGAYKKLDTPGVDTGMGFERLVVTLQSKHNIYQTDLFASRIEGLGGDSRSARIVADHERAASRLVEDGVRPSNTDRGYILRRIIRRAVRHAQILDVTFSDLVSEESRSVVQEEEQKFLRTLEKGLKEFEKGENPFVLFTSYGFPIEMTEELAKEQGRKIDRTAFDKKMSEHQALSRTSAAGKFKGGLASTGEMETKYHTATHLLLQALKKILGDHVVQKGSNITTERLRFDFSHPDKLTDEEIKKIEALVNEKIIEDLPVTREEKDGVKTYSIGDFSKELCGGPHVEHTGVLGVFRVEKEESSSAGVRRIKAVLE